MGVQDTYVEDRFPSSVRGLLFANALSRVYMIQTSSTGFANAEHRSIIHTFYASTLSKHSPFPVLIGGQQLSDSTQCPFTISASYFQRVRE